MEPFVMALLHRFDAARSVKAVSSDEIHTLDGGEFPKEWWVRTSFVPVDAAVPEKAKECAWLTIEYSRWEDSEDWTMQAFFRVADVEFSLNTDSSVEQPILNLVAAQLPSGDIQIVEEMLRAHFGGPGTTIMASATGHTVAS